MLVCHCFGVTDRELRAAVRRGDEAIVAGSKCGGCRPAVDAVIAGARGAITAPRTLPVIQASQAMFVPYGAAAKPVQND